MIVGLGVDIIEVKRFSRQWDSGNERFFQRLFTPAEIAYCQDKKWPAIHFAARFAAKEALLKALGTGLVAPFSWKEMEVVRTPTGQPEMAVHGQIALHLQHQGSPTCRVSLSHTNETAVAVVILELDFQGE